MTRSIPFLLLASAFFMPGMAFAQVQSQDDESEKPAISITSPDTGKTFAYGTIKDHTLVWNPKTQMLTVHVTFTDAEENQGMSNDDQHEFTLPGVKLDAAKKLFFVITEKGEAIPVAHFKRALFFNVIETTPNAVVRIRHPRGVITVILEAISPDDPAMTPAPTDPDGSHKVNLDSILQQ